jgi:predicted phosphodiesterase
MIASKQSKSGIIIFITALSLVIVNSMAAGTGQFDTPVSFAVIGDRTGEAVDSVYEEIVAEIYRLRPDFVMSVGDCIEGPARDENETRARWREFLDIIEPFGENFYIAPGNNDIWNDMSEKVYRDMVGKPYHSVDLKGIHFIMLDAARWDLGVQMPAEQMQWLEQDLKANEDADYIMVFLHKPAWYNTVSKGKEGVLHNLFKKYGVDAVFTGHYHEYFSGEHDGIMYTGMGSSGGAIGEAASELDFHFLWVTVDDEGIHLAPIKKGSVYDWRETTDVDKLAYDPVYLQGLTIADAIKIDGDLKAKPGQVSVLVDNSYTEFDLNDTLRWNIPDNWKIEPAVMPVTVKAGESAKFGFNAECTGDLFPLPSARVDFMFKEGRYAPARTDLRISRNVSCNHVETAPNIDGHITEQCWKNPESKYFSPEGKNMTIDPVNIFFAYDRDNLYIAAFCAELQMDSLVANASEHDGAVYGEDCVGFFFEPIAGSDTVYQIYFGASGAAFDQKITRGEDGWMEYDRSWNGDYEVKAVKSDKFWSLEARIPVNQFNTSIEKGKDWKLNFRRKQKRLETAADWQVPIDADPHLMGVLIME